jgi:tRNA threonylcarbamoyladenosine biosynthesis protein TsaE
LRESSSGLIAAATPEATRELGGRLARAIARLPVDAPLLVDLAGDLGAGKTTFVSGVLHALGHAGPVRSPTYTLIEPYQAAGRELYHCDLYRLRHPDELDDLGLLDLRAPGKVLLVEWPERAAGRLGTADLAIEITYEGAGRTLKWDARSDAGQALAAGLSGET